MKQLIKVQNNSNLAKDPISGAVININNTEIEQARLRKKIRQEEREKLTKLENEMSDIKQMLVKLMEKQDAN
jgi:hypothetical protein